MHYFHGALDICHKIKGVSEIIQVIIAEIYKIFYPDIKEYTILLKKKTHWSFWKTDYILTHKANHSKLMCAVSIFKRNIPKLLWSQYYSNTQARRTYNKKRTYLLTSLVDIDAKFLIKTLKNWILEHMGKLNIGQPPWSSWLDARHST